MMHLVMVTNAELLGMHLISVASIVSSSKDPSLMNEEHVQHGASSHVITWPSSLVVENDSMKSARSKNSSGDVM